MPGCRLAEMRRSVISFAYSRPLAVRPLPHHTLCCCACCHGLQVGNDEVDADDQQQQQQQQNHQQQQQQQQEGQSGGEGDGGQMGGLSAAELAHILWDQASLWELLLPLLLLEQTAASWLGRGKGRAG